MLSRLRQANVMVTTAKQMAWEFLWRGCCCWLMQNFQRVGENYGPVLAVSGPKFIKFWDDVFEPLLFPALFSRLSISCSPPEILALKVAIELQVGPCHCLW